MYKHILIATDGSALAQKAVTHGLALAKSVGAEGSFVTYRPELTLWLPRMLGML